MHLITGAKLTGCIILNPQMPPVNTGGHKEVTKRQKYKKTKIQKTKRQKDKKDKKDKKTK